MPTRRTFLHRMAMSATAFAAGQKFLQGQPLSRPIGLQLYTVGAELKNDFHGTLRKIAAIGYKEVELADSYNKSAAELRTAFADSGLTCRGAFWFNLQQSSAEFMNFAKELGVKYVINSFNPPEKALALLRSDKPDKRAFVQALDNMSLDDYKRSAETCNKLGEAAKKLGLQYAYHNHNLEFKKLGDSTAYDLLLSSTDPELVKMELDCGWMSAAGHDPSSYLARYPTRYRLLHIKAFKPGPPTLTLKGPISTELVRGPVDYKAVFAAAKKTEVEQYYVEQEPPFTVIPALEAVRMNFEYLRSLKV